MPLNDILNCPEDDLWAILDADRPLDRDRWFLSKGIGMIELSMLGEYRGLGTYDDLMSGFALVGEPRDDGPWPQTLPSDLIADLREITDDEIAAVTPRWSQIDEFRGDMSPEGLADYLTRLRSYLRPRSGEFFLVTAL